MISLCRSRSYQRKYLEDVCSIFGQVRHVVSHIEVSLPEKPLTPNNIVEALKGPQRQLLKEALFVQYEKEKMSAFFRLTYQVYTSLKENNSFVHSFLQVSSKATFLMHGNFLHATVQMRVLRFKILVLISPTIQWHILTPL